LEGQINMIINELGVKVMEREFLDANGHYVAEMNTIVINGKLSKREKLKALLHELGHACKHHKDYYLYNIAFSLHSKMEYEANYYMIEKLLDSYILATGLEPQQINYMKFIEDAGLNPSYEPEVKKILAERVRYCENI
jgi:Zn-dependent peptidase ImmA (M78 family)